MRRRWRTCGRKNRQFKMLSDGIDYSAGNATALSLVELYIPIRNSVRTMTEIGYNFALNPLKQYDFSKRKIRNELLRQRRFR